MWTPLGEFDNTNILTIDLNIFVQQALRVQIKKGTQDPAESQKSTLATSTILSRISKNHSKPMKSLPSCIPGGK